MAYRGPCEYTGCHNTTAKKYCTPYCRLKDEGGKLYYDGDVPKLSHPLLED